MSFCCGASMTGAIGTVKYKRTLIHNVPILYCPICQSFEVHEKVRDEYEILAEYAHADHAPEVYFTDYVDVDNLESLFDQCVEINGSTEEVLRAQIDHALDLLAVAKKLRDQKWQEDLLYRLKVLSGRLRREQSKSKNSNL
ncbi:hypothetical protein CathTA2_1774 [Caldalkalibacillus thermarum TA2.A1]|uniref:YgiT-type zinc finger domain-containing protein n=1 Tax=Caldalkalibacillus thermarum (strain TA2.A1) TaxID=986075 RepID=F5L7H4_CALTT|nr:hypothetical protein [Caldalkalibacillus thermarum]EGL82688.1 hypothetical protein CathTA2_1774 [Caldalkalibacillus thermarum TA2.A1]QZT33765.1 hypothetical protein HUR95_16360 [Caldalkalibacillus thermarum TA2.A1]GGK22122.1 hypothetical protein GCM10010965_13830 [Caldalkalibacillus thermarum]